MTKKQTNKTHNNEGSVIVEIIIMILISFCILFLIAFTNNKLDEFDEREEAMLMHPNQREDIDEDLAKKIIAFRPDACKLIELYDENFQSVFKVAFTDETDDIRYNNLTEYPDLIALFQSAPQGHTSFEIDGKKEDIVFEWTDSSDGNKYLLIVYISRPIVKNTWIFSFVCYIILILVFTLMTRMMFKQNNARIQHYKSLSKT